MVKLATRDAAMEQLGTCRGTCPTRVRGTAEPSPGETEAFFVLNGAASFTVDGETREVGAGRYLAIPDGAVHSFKAIGPEPARLLIINAPGHMHEAFFTGTGEPIDEGTPAPAPMDGPPDVARILQVASDCGMVILPPPRH